MNWPPKRDDAANLGERGAGETGMTTTGADATPLRTTRQDAAWDQLGRLLDEVRLGRGFDSRSYHRARRTLQPGKTAAQRLARLEYRVRLLEDALA